VTHVPANTRTPSLSPEAEAIVAVEHPNPHAYLGVHRVGNETRLRVWRPEAVEVTALLDDGSRVPLTRIHDQGLFEASLGSEVSSYRLELGFRYGATLTVDDPYRFWPTLGEVDLHLIGEGRHERLWEPMGARRLYHQGVDGTAFAVWAPAARSVRVIGEFNYWDGRVHPMRVIGASGVWELFVPDVGDGAQYKFEILTQDSRTQHKTDPMAKATEPSPGSAAVVFTSRHSWNDGEWLAQRSDADPMHERMSIYEVHLGSWRRKTEEGDRPLNYREIAVELADHVTELGFTHIELLPVMQYPYGGSWGYQVSGYYAPTPRYGSPDDLRFMIDHLHQRGIGVIADWVPAHFPRDEWALARFDGTALYEHADPRRGEHPDWGTLVFNFGRHEVRNFLLANALYWIEEFHVDGLRVDAVASMLYLDYSREPHEWVPNIYGGRENLEAIAFLQELNSVVHLQHPGVVTIAEESTAWGGVSKPVDVGGLGFTHKWNMGWMHDTLDYFGLEPIHRKWHHHELTFGLLYAWTENFVLPLSHDEVVHLKRSLLGKMPGDRWQQFANLRALYAWMWAHPGKELLFMGAELAQEAEWAHDRSLDWHLLELPRHRGVHELVARLNAIEAAEPALWWDDFSSDGFQWIDANDAEHSVLSFLRLSSDGSRPLACIANLTPVPRHGYRVGLPESGRWEEVLSTDDERWGGSGITNDRLETDDVAWQGMDQSAVLTLPPLAVVWIVPERPSAD
jgi:1,4-alpha-glucan branching enzyme